ncbi:MAG: arylsulfatase [Candidatus Aminicenantes bacterium]
MTTTCGVSLSLCGTNCFEKKSDERPNIVLILADDLGYGDLSCYGQTHFQTPHIDRLAAEGMKFTDFYAGSTVCAPSRSSLMTGLHTGHTPIRGNKAVHPEGQEPLPASTITVAKLLKKAGYTTGAYGKWGLGSPHSEGDPNNQGFDEFFGYNCQRNAHHYYPWHLWHNQEKVVLKENEGRKKGTYAPNLIQKKALQFIENNKDTPFFLFIPSIIPHAELFAPEEYMVTFRGKFKPEKTYKGVDSGDRYRRGAYGSQPEGHAAFAAMICLLDDQVAEITAKLKEFRLEKNTLILFSSDNGPHLEGGADPDYFDSNGPVRGYKRDLYDGGIRVPFIARWPDKIKAGSVCHHVSTFWDMMPTFCEIAGSESPENIDGLSFLPVLLGNNRKQQTHDFLYWEFHERKSTIQAVRMGKWKAFRAGPARPLELYDLEKDIGETGNIADDHPEIIRRIEDYLRTARSESAIWPLKTS